MMVTLIFDDDDIDDENDDDVVGERVCTHRLSDDFQVSRFHVNTWLH